MVWILIVFAVEQLRDVVEADEYYSEDFLYQDITELGSISNAIEIHDVCLYDDAYYIVGGGVRLNDYYSGMDAVLIKYQNGIEWYKTYGGAREDKFLGLHCGSSIYVVGNTYSTDFLSSSPNFLTGFMMELDYEGNVLSTSVINHPLDVYPTVVWEDSSIMVAGYLDNFGDKDIFILDGDIQITHFSGHDRIYGFNEANHIFYGSTTSKELGALNLNPMVIGLDGVTDVYTSSSSGEIYGQYGYLGEEVIQYESGFLISESEPNIVYSDDLITVKNIEDKLVILKEVLIPVNSDEGEILEYIDDIGLYQYRKSVIGDVIIYNDWRTIYTFEHNVNEEFFYGEFTLFFTGEAKINNEDILSGETLGIGEYVFDYYGSTVEFQVKPNNTDVLILDIENEFTKEPTSEVINRRLIVLPVLVLGNILYKKYQ